MRNHRRSWRHAHVIYIEFFRFPQVLPHETIGDFNTANLSGSGVIIVDLQISALALLKYYKAVTRSDNRSDNRRLWYSWKTHSLLVRLVQRKTDIIALEYLTPAKDETIVTNPGIVNKCLVIPLILHVNNRSRNLFVTHREIAVSIQSSVLSVDSNTCQWKHRILTSTIQENSSSTLADVYTSSGKIHIRLHLWQPLSIMLP